MTESSYLDYEDRGALSKKFTLEKYVAELTSYYEAGLRETPSIEDYTDPLYNKKYAHTMPPLEAYSVRPP